MTTHYKLSVETIYGQEVASFSLDGEMSEIVVVAPGLHSPEYDDLRVKLREIGVPEDAEFSPYDLIRFKVKRWETDE